VKETILSKLKQLGKEKVKGEAEERIFFYSQEVYWVRFIL
jgi:hypothetical protein